MGLGSLRSSLRLASVPMALRIDYPYRGCGGGEEELRPEEGKREKRERVRRNKFPAQASLPCLDGSLPDRPKYSEGTLYVSKLMVVCVNVLPSFSVSLAPPPFLTGCLSLEKRRNNVELFAGGGFCGWRMACSRQKGTRERWVL